MSIVDKLACGFIALRFREISTWKFKKDLWQRGKVAWGRRLASCAGFLLGLNTKRGDKKFSGRSVVGRFFSIPPGIKVLL